MLSCQQRHLCLITPTRLIFLIKRKRSIHSMWTEFNCEENNNNKLKNFYRSINDSYIKLEIDLVFSKPQHLDKLTLS